MDTLAQRLQASLGATFTLERELGGGGVSRVFLAQERALERQVVITTLDLETSAAGTAEGFRREVRTIAELQRPNTVTLLATGGDDTLLWYATLTTPTPAATATPKIITPGQTRVMLTVLVVAVIAAAGVVGSWWFRRADGAPRAAEGTESSR
jgi:hypothetical protein